MGRWRTEKLASLIREEISKILLKEVNDPRIKEVWLTRVKMSDDLKRAEVFFIGGDTNADKALAHASRFISKLLFKRLRIKNLVEVSFQRENER